MEIDLTYLIKYKPIKQINKNKNKNKFVKLISPSKYVFPFIMLVTFKLLPSALEYDLRLNFRPW